MHFELVGIFAVAETAAAFPAAVAAVDSGAGGVGGAGEDAESGVGVAVGEVSHQTAH